MRSHFKIRTFDKTKQVYLALNSMTYKERNFFILKRKVKRNCNSNPELQL